MVFRRKASQLKQADPGYKDIMERASTLARALARELRKEKETCGGVVPLEKSIARHSADFAFLERRKLTALMEETAPTLGLTWGEMAALDAFWKAEGGFLAKLRGRNLVEMAARTDLVVAFVPSRRLDKEEPAGYIPVADVRAAATLRQLVLGLNPGLRLHLEEVPSSDADLRKMIHRWTARDDSDADDDVAAQRENTAERRGPARRRAAAFAAFLEERLGRDFARVTLVSIGSPRSNPLTAHLLDTFFNGEPWPFDFHAGPSKRDRAIKIGSSAFRDHAIICYRWAMAGKRLELCICGDSSETTSIAARELVSFQEQVLPKDGVGWALVRVERDAKSLEATTATLVEGYPATWPPPRNG
jgi:hypothetical protein